MSESSSRGKPAAPPSPSRGRLFLKTVPPVAGLRLSLNLSTAPARRCLLSQDFGLFTANKVFSRNLVGRSHDPVLVHVT